MAVDNRQLYDLKKSCLVDEQEVSSALLGYIYRTAVGRLLVFGLLKRRLMSWLVGLWARSPLSRRSVGSFVTKHQIDMHRFEQPTGGFRNFNQFFTRRLRSEFLTFPTQESILGAPTDCRLKVVENVDSLNLHLLKGERFDLISLLEDHRLCKLLWGGSAVICRLSPVDYHRFHFIDDGTPSEVGSIGGHLHSVNPIALQTIGRLLVRNRRAITSFRSQNFGHLVYVEIGAMNVGSIVQTFQPNERVKRGAEKGFFSLGGSTIVLLFQKGIVEFDEQILSHSREGREVLVSTGMPIGRAIPPLAT